MIREYNKNDINFINNSLNNFEKNLTVDSIFSNPFSNILVYQLGENPIAYIVFSRYYERIEIDYIYVVQSQRKKGFGSKLIDYVINKNSDTKNITLEVNVNNTSAINLYKKMGFQIVAIREKYYKDGTSAYLMERK